MTAPHWKAEHKTTRVMYCRLVVAEHWEDDPGHTSYRDPTYGDLAEAKLVPAADYAAAQGRLEDMGAAGVRLANCAYNLSQNEKLDEQTRKALKEAQCAWDEAARR